MNDREMVLRMIAGQFPHWQHPWDEELLAEAKAFGVDPGWVPKESLESATRPPVEDS